MTPLVSWCVLLAVGTLGAAFAIAVARWLDGADDRAWLRDIEDWRAMCRELEIDDYEDEQT